MKSNGYKILKRNFRCTSGEIDIVAKKGDLVVFVEVKARRSADFGDPLEFVDLKKQTHIIRCARFFLTTMQLEDVDVRFDVIGITGKNDIEWIENAFMEVQ